MATTAEVRRCTPGHRRRNTGRGHHPNHPKRRTASEAQMTQWEAMRARRRARNQTTPATTSHRAPSSTQATG